MLYRLLDRSKSILTLQLQVDLAGVLDHPDARDSVARSVVSDGAPTVESDAVLERVVAHHHVAFIPRSQRTSTVGRSIELSSNDSCSFAFFE